MANTKKPELKEPGPSDNQLIDFKKSHKTEQLTTGYGRPLGERSTVITVGPRGPLLLSDFPYIEDTQRFDRERIPERVVHAKGGGAFGVFEATDDISDICKAQVFKRGTKTRVLARFSTVAGESGSADTVRDPRGFAIKMYTDEGIWDLVANNTPIFFVRDPFLFQMFIHSQKRNPQTHLKDPNMVWDFFANHPQATHQFLFLYSDRGVPDGFRHMHGYGSHTFKMVNDKDEFVWVKFHFRCDQGIKNIDPTKAKILAGEQPDYALADLYNAIAKKDYPSWTLYVQVMTHEQAQKLDFNPFDLTKVISQKEFPLRRVGKMTLNENHENYFAQIEQAAFSPSHMPPGIEASPDKMLQGRLFSYGDTHLHRLGTNYLHIPVNQPETNKNVKVCTYQRDGQMQVSDNFGGRPNYYKNSMHGPDVTNRERHLEHATFESGMAARHEAGGDDNFSQPRIFYQKVLDDRGRAHLIQNIVEHLQQCTDKDIIYRSVAVLANVDDDFGKQLATKLNVDLPKKQRSLLTPNIGVNSSNECNSTPYKRRQQTNQALEALGHLVKDPIVDDVDNKLNKNDVLSLTLARLLRHKYWPSNLSNKNVQYAANIDSTSTANDLNGFIIVLNTQGRIILLSDNVEHYLRKNVRSLYPQLTSIYECVSSDDHASIHQLLSNPTNMEQHVLCTWNLPRGKRPSRTHTESRSMLMTGHFFFINHEENTEQQEPLFIARCEHILSSTPNIPTNSLGLTSPTILRFVLNDQLHISEISSNTEALLGYEAGELIDQSIKRFMATENLNALEQARQNCILGQHYTTMNVFDLYTRNGDRLSFLCNTHMLIEGRRKVVKLGFLAQLIDPSIQHQCALYANKQNLERLKHTTTQGSMYMSNLNTSGTTNILLSNNNEQCLNLNNIPTVCPAVTIPQRRKRRRMNPQTIKSEPMSVIDQAPYTPQIINDLNESQTIFLDSFISSSSISSSLSASPIQELDYKDELFPNPDDLFHDDKIKLIQDFPSIDDVNDIFGINNNQQFCLFTPTFTTLSFFA
ncbi:unnamed protein product [Adineta steineri]|uniref:Catalase n=1 Tax=Adineta steineri TaxID=433720 RepID=A0A813WLP8_9BILA|nr:unnamed protein product [Adineta steineri]